MNFRKGFLFIFLAIPGALVFVFSTIVILGKFFDPNGVPTSYLILLLLQLAGAIMTLVGLEKIRQWKYIFVFLSIPFSVFIAGILSPIVVMLGLPWLLYPSTALLIFALPYLVNRTVQNHYNQRHDE